MRIAFAGTHRVGKSTLLEQMSLALPAYSRVDEPYHLLEDAGHEFGWPPSADDFRAQIHRSIAEIARSAENTLFDRCPADLLAYLVVHGEDIDDLLDGARQAMRALDLVVQVPIEEPDRIAVPAHEDLEERRAVAEALESLLYDEELADDVVVVRGDLEARFAQVTRVMNRLTE